MGAPASGQLLDLSGPEAPEAGAGLSALELSNRLDRAAERFADRADTGEGIVALRASAKAAFRTAAAALADAGESRRDEGSAAVLWAMTIDARAEAIDELIDGTADAALLTALATDFEALDLAWSRGETGAASALDEQMGSAFAVLARSTLGQAPAGPGLGVGWFSGLPAVTADEVRSRGSTLAELGASESALSALESLAREIETLRAWPTYRSRAEAMARDAVAAVDAVGALPGWTPGPARSRLVADVGEALALPMGDRAVALRAATQHARLLSALDDLEAGREADRLRARAADAIANRSTADRAALPASRLAADTIELSVSRGRVREDGHIVRELRPAWRRLVPLVRDATVNARDDAIDLLIDPTQVTDPGVLATIAAQRRLFEDFALLERLSARVEAGLEGPPALVPLVRDRLRGLSQSAGDEGELDDSLAMLRAVEAQLSAFDRIALDAETAVRVMGERGRELPTRQRELREAWLRGWAVPGGTGPEAETLAELDQLSRLTALLADAEAFTRLDTLMTWPGFELSVRARRAIASGLTEGIDEMVPDAMRGGNAVARDRSEARLTTLRGEHAAALLAGRLARLGRDAGLSLADPMQELALGPPVDEAWMAPRRAAIADVCRYAEEFGRLAVTAGRDDPELARIRSLVNWRALRLLESIERDAR